MEMSFLDQDQILGIMERLLAKIFKETVNYDVPLPLRRMKYWDAMDTYGSDKPDTRYGLTLKDVKAIMAKSSFAGFEGQEYIKAIVIPGKGKETSRKKMDELNVEARKFGLKGVMNLKVENGLLAGSFIKFMDEGLQKELMAALELKEDDLVLFASSAYRRDIDFGLGALRTKFAKEMGLIKEAPTIYSGLSTSQCSTQSKVSQAAIPPSIIHSLVHATRT
jgi:aspartyl-tRNA synthetase